jgi:hypothetical protein
MRAAVPTFVASVVFVLMSSAAFAGNGPMALGGSLTSPAALLMLVIGIVIGAVAVVVWRRWH